MSLMGHIGHLRRRRVIAGDILVLATLLAVMGEGSAFALDEVAYGVAKEPWTEGMGNHRAIVRVEQTQDAVMARIRWRRRDRDPERKQIIVVDAASGLRITNVARLHLDRFEGVLAFQPQTAPGDYFVYYLPFVPEPNWGSYNHDYLPPQETAASDWKARLPADTEGLPRASVVRLEARTEFDSSYPMEVVATPDETQAMCARSAAFTLQNSRSSTELHPEGRTIIAPAYLVFPEDRRFPIRMTDELPLRWVKSGPGKEFRGEAHRNEFYVFQIGVWAAWTNLATVDVEFKGEVAGWLNCFNTGGTNWDGKPFRKGVNVPQGKVQALWIGVSVPRDAKPGEHHATVKVIPKNAAPASVQMTLKVLTDELADRGDSEPWRLARLRWLDSTLGADSDPTSLYPPLTVSDRSVTGDGFRVSFRASEVCDLPSQLASEGVELLHGPLELLVDGAGNTLKGLRIAYLPELTSDGAGQAKLISGRTAPNLNVRSRATVEFDGTLLFKTQLRGLGDFRADNLRLEIPLRPEVATHFMGIGLPAGVTPTNYTWRGEGL